MAHALAKINGTFRFAYRFESEADVAWHDREENGDDEACNTRSIRVPTLMTCDEALTLVGADAPVMGRPMSSPVFQGRGLVGVPGRQSLWRVEAGRNGEGEPSATHMGDVTTSYGKIEYSDTLDVFRTIFGHDVPCVDTIGLLGRGERFFASAKLPNATHKIGTRGDCVVSNIMVHTGHDGTTTSKGLFGKIRPVCQNTVNANLATACNMFAVRHTSKATDRLADAQAILANEAKHTFALVAAFNAMAVAECNAARVKLTLDTLFPDRLADDGKTVTSWAPAEKRSKILALFEGEGDGADMAGRTDWGLWNAIVQYLDRNEGDDATGVMTPDRLVRSTFNGPTVALRQKAFALLTPKGVSGPALVTV